MFSNLPIKHLGMLATLEGVSNLGDGYQSEDYNYGEIGIVELWVGDSRYTNKRFGETAASLLRMPAPKALVSEWWQKESDSVFAVIVCPITELDLMPTVSSTLPNGRRRKGKGNLVYLFNEKKPR
jgi:hypothetical protein